MVLWYGLFNTIEEFVKAASIQNQVVLATIDATQQNIKTFNPLDRLREVSGSTRQAQSNLMQDMSSMQSKSMNTMFNIGQMLPSFMNWGAYKTTISSNGRISIPEAERNALSLGEGDLVQVIILPIAKKSKNKGVKQ